ncbi:MAG TPA: hypothetical protein VFZ91_04830 [Allosphingosinicella sp.]
MDFIVNAAPIIGALLVCAIAWISVRRAYRKARAETRPPAE